MNSKLKTALVFALALTTIGAGVFAWQQYQTLSALRKTPAKSSDDDQASLRKRLAEAQHRMRDLQSELDALKARSSSDDAPPDSVVSNDPRGRNGRFRGGPQMFQAMMNDPKIAQLMTSREKAMLDSRYAALFKSLTQGTAGSNAAPMSPEQLDAFKNLLVEKENTLRDTMMAARAQGITDRSEINQLAKNAQAEVDAQLQSTLGADSYAQYQQYEATLPQRNLVSQLTQSLSYTNAPLSDEQSQQLIQILAADAKPPSNGQLRNALGFGGGPGGLGGVPITNAAIAQAQTVLAPAQLQALTALQQQQQAQEQIRQAARAAMQSGAPQSGAAATPKPAPPK